LLLSSSLYVSSVHDMITLETQTLNSQNQYYIFYVFLLSRNLSYS
jgi:hypothetical protein